ncbi:MAG TPA: PHP domain-containing protein [Candidatus Brocadiia bacterium]|nr:PHP domain-containing protein [Candidatus Brocadiia bacterium]
MSNHLYTPDAPCSYDLHLHTCWSYDALASVDTCFAQARRRGLRLISITDHHVFDNLGEVLAAADRYPDVGFILGAELTVHTSIGAVDLVCHGFAPESAETLKDVWDAYHEWQRRRGATFAEGMRRLGYDYSDADWKALLESYRPAKTLAAQGMTHVKNCVQAAYFAQRGFIPSRDAVSDLYQRLSQVVDLPHYPAVEFVRPRLRQEGVMVSIAHPAGYFQGADRRRMEALFEEIGFDGVECSHPSVRLDLTQGYRAFCEARGLYSSGGTDCHEDAELVDWLGRHHGRDEWLDEFLERAGERVRGGGAA